MNYNEKRQVMFGGKYVIDMDIDPAVSNMDIPADIKIPFLTNNKVVQHVVVDHYQRDELEMQKKNHTSEYLDKCAKVDQNGNGKVSGNK